MKPCLMIALFAMVAHSPGAQVTGDYRSKNASSTGSTAALIFAGIPAYSHSMLSSTNLTHWESIWTTNGPANGAFQYIALSAPQPGDYDQLRYNPSFADSATIQIRTMKTKSLLLRPGRPALNGRACALVTGDAGHILSSGRYSAGIGLSGRAG